MEKLVSNWYNVRPVPEDYIYPPEKRPGNIHVPKGEGIPVIDLTEAEKGDPALVIQKILKAAQEFGFFQVVNHGVSENLMDETLSVVREFFQMPDEAKQHLYTEDFSNKCIYFTSCENYANEKVHMWRDFLQHQCHPLDKWQQFWPVSPARYQEIVGACSVGIKKLASRILGLISEGLGLERGHFENELSGCMVLTALQYPPCPEPSLTLGTCQHDDANLITFLLQDEVSGLQIFKDGQWIGVEPVPHAFVVNVGCLLQVISNDRLKSVKHRVVTNASRFRSSAAFFVTAVEGSVIEPAKGAMDQLHPARYRPFTPKDFYMKFFENDADTEATFNHFRASLTP
ncbi:hyoscyamine 6-dioxygenase-like [Prosopis cineraria]|uniref:hyoscyamine 6-dioxygenase-like n=1 Tax=Prosopis cineraria TaxID=364024 RepID=UPI00241090B1|nr:hyoscyamine 6-dioxygenase-like [Prosopis cineraria]